MKVIVICVPNTVNDAEIQAAVQAVGSILSLNLTANVLTEEDVKATPRKPKESQVIAIVHKIMSMCGDPRASNFKSKLMNVLLNNGDINVEAIDILSGNLDYSDVCFLEVNDLGWLPGYVRNFRSFIR